MARGARAGLDCRVHGPRSGRDACVMADGGARMDGCASVPPTASQTIAASSVDAVWGSGNHHEAHMRGTGSVPPQHTTSCHAVACGPRRRRATCACHTRDQTHTHQGGARGGGGGSGGWGKRACSEPCPPPTKRQIESWPPRERRSCSGRRWLKWQTRPSHVGTGRLLHTRAVPIPPHTKLHPTCTHTGATHRI